MKNKSKHSACRLPHPKTKVDKRGIGIAKRGLRGGGKRSPGGWRGVRAVDSPNRLQ